MKAAARTARWLAFAAFLLYAITGGGRIVGSDEVTMLDVARSFLKGEVAVPEGATLQGRDGRFYSKNAGAQALLALPLVFTAEAAAHLSRLEPQRQTLAVRFVVSFFNAIVTAILIGMFYWGLRRLAVAKRAALATSLMLGFATPLCVYAKSFMADPLQALGLLLTLLGASLAAERREGREASAAEVLLGFGILLAVSVKLSMLPLALAAAAPLIVDPPRRWVAPLLGLSLALLGHGLYDIARFGTPFETGYGAQATPAAYTTPLVVGLYGLLISSGKGVLWFAPSLWLAPSGWRAMTRAARDAAPGFARRVGLTNAPGRAAWGALLAWGAGLLLYGRFQHWASDGSFGPRYLIPLLPLGFVCVAFALAPPRGSGAPGGRSVSRAVRAAALALAALGLVVQIGGVAIYYGAEMREAGDYPYHLALDDPHLMSDSHFNPRFSPIVGHWRMLGRNAREHLAGQAPRLSGNTADTRVGVSQDDQTAMLHALDFWWLYLGYAGFPRLAVLGALALLLALLIYASVATARAFRDEGRAA